MEKSRQIENFAVDKEEKKEMKLLSLIESTGIVEISIRNEKHEIMAGERADEKQMKKNVPKVSFYKFTRFPLDASHRPIQSYQLQWN